MDGVVQLDAFAQECVDAYIEYDRIVGNADGGKMFTPAELEEFKRKKAEARAPENRLYVSWRCIPTEMDCKMIGPSTRCFCGHLFKHHDSDRLKDTKVSCREQGCPCLQFSYVPGHGSTTLRCSSCRHDSLDHRPTGKKRCAKCSKCEGFRSAYTCGCGYTYSEHATVFERRAEREAAGRPVDNLAGGGAMYAGVGGVTDFSSLIDGHERYDRRLPGGGFPGAGGLPEHKRNALLEGRTDGDLLDAGAVGGPPAVRKKLTQAEEFALYEKKYTGGGGGGASGYRTRPSASASSSRGSSRGSRQQPIRPPWEFEEEGREEETESRPLQGSRLDDGGRSNAAGRVESIEDEIEALQDKIATAKLSQAQMYADKKKLQL
mmetsp:Transcript_25591/g.64188  ORF Transcript_25591/g.64188 Transcript_25591/m.64188 type:complete len:376 (-) Transcript_25591:621-1748(-)